MGNLLMTKDMKHCYFCLTYSISSSRLLVLFISKAFSFVLLVPNTSVGPVVLFDKNNSVELKFCFMVLLFCMKINFVPEADDNISVTLKYDI